MKLSITAVTLSILLSVCAAQPTRTTKTAPKTKAAPTTKPAPTCDEDTREILERMEGAGKEFKTLEAKITYKQTNTTLGDSELRTGWVAYQAATTTESGGKTVKISPMFRLHFETIRMGRGKTIKEPVDYAYDGKNLTVARARTKTVTRFQLPPGAQGANMLQLGKGPMPLPFGQKASDMIKFFVCTRRPNKKTDPKDTVYLSLVPRKEHAKNLSTQYIHMWVSNATWAPVKIVTRDKSKNVITSSFTKPLVNSVLKRSLFTIPKPLTWKLIIQPLRPGQDIKP
jgi:hypothetical protein